VRSHYTGSAEGSTLRLTLGALLSDELGIELRRVGSGARRTFSEGEKTLSSWMAANAFVCWTGEPEPWVLEEQLILRYDLPLNLDQNRRNAFHPELSAARRAAKELAARLPIVLCRPISTGPVDSPHFRSIRSACRRGEAALEWSVTRHSTPLPTRLWRMPVRGLVPAIIDIAMGKVIPFDHLAGADLTVEAIYEGGTAGHAADDPLGKLVPVGNQGGFRYAGSSRNDDLRLVACIPAARTATGRMRWTSRPASSPTSATTASRAGSCATPFGAETRFSAPAFTGSTAARRNARRSRRS
jgi:hypothetical protein